MKTQRTDMLIPSAPTPHHVALAIRWVAYNSVRGTASYRQVWDTAWRMTSDTLDRMLRQRGLAIPTRADEAEWADMIADVRADAPTH